MKANYRLIVKTNGKYIKMAFEDCHDAKSTAGSMFYHDPKVESVFVVDVIGTHFLYLVQNHPEKTENQSSRMAIL